MLELVRLLPLLAGQQLCVRAINLINDGLRYNRTDCPRQTEWQYLVQMRHFHKIVSWLKNSIELLTCRRMRVGIPERRVEVCDYFAGHLWRDAVIFQSLRLLVDRLLGRQQTSYIIIYAHIDREF